MKPSQFVPKVDRTDKSLEFTAGFLAAILTWGGIGWMVDRVLGTAPLLMVLGFIVGNATGIYLLYLRSRDGESLAHNRADPDNPHSEADSAQR
ncbi:MAG TPA: AtpZ/AtpI family protein [Euzebya sp.]|nr:AtpZ/AtpI family protein [Euzebya sp.]